MILDFKEIPAGNKEGASQGDFEHFASEFLQWLDYEIVSHPGLGPDGGQDLIVEKFRKGDTRAKKVRFLVSCKHYAHHKQGAGKSVGPADDPNITDRVAKHKCSGFIGFYSTSASKDLLTQLDGNDGYDHEIFDSRTIERLLMERLQKENYSMLYRYFPISGVAFIKALIEIRKLETETNKETSHGKNTANATEKIQALSDIYGRIEQVAVSCPISMGELTKEYLLARFQGLFEAFGDQVRFDFVVHSDRADGFGNRKEVEAVRAWEEALRESCFDPGHHALHFYRGLESSEQLPYNWRPTSWIDDSLIVATSSIGTVLLHGSTNSEPAGNFSRMIASELGLLVRTMKFSLHAGDLLFGANFALVGIRSIEEARMRFFGDLPVDVGSSKVCSVLATEFGVAYVIPLGLREGLEGNLGVGLHYKPPLDTFFTIKRFVNLAGKAKNGDEMVFLSVVSLRHSDSSFSESEYLEIRSFFDHVHYQLEQSSRSFPGPKFRISRTFSVVQDRIFYGYNEVLIESFQGTKRVYLPHYEIQGFQEIQEIISREYILEGFVRVHWIKGNFKRFASLGGSLASLVKVLKRSAF